MCHSSHGKLYILFLLRNDQADHDCQRVHPTCLNWNILDPKGFIAAYLQLGEITEKCCDDFRKLLESTLDRCTALLASGKVAHRWQEQGTKANGLEVIFREEAEDTGKDKNVDEDEGVDEDERMTEGEGTSEDKDDEDDEEREADAADDALIEEAVPLILDLMNGKDFHKVPLQAMNVRAVEIYEDEMDEERMQAGQHVDSVTSWLSLLDGRESDLHADY